MQAIIDHIGSRRDEYLDELQTFLRIPSVSTDSTHRQGMQRAAEYVKEQLDRSGMTTEIVPTEGHPIVYGERIEHADRPTVLIYGHYDVQPVDPIDLWETSPFEPDIRNDRLFARGSADDKGQMFIHFKSTQAFLEVAGELPLNIKFLIEGEEEIGSPNLQPFVDSRLEQLKADAVLISDSTMFSKETPSIAYGLRGLSYLQIDVQGPARDLHSGSFGGPVANPAFVLSQILASLKDENDRVLVPGFYDRVRELSSEEKAAFASLPFDEEAYRADLGVKKLAGERGYTTLEQLWARPTLEVNGLLSGFTGEGAKTVLPSRAMAKVSMRLVPDQDPDEIDELFESHVMAQTPETVSVKVAPMHSGKPWVASLDHPALQAAANAVEAGFGKRPVFQREGGTIPIVSIFQEMLGIPTVLMGIGLPDENAHAPNENLYLPHFFNGIKASAYFMAEYGRVQ